GLMRRQPFGNVLGEAVVLQRDFTDAHHQRGAVAGLGARANRGDRGAHYPAVDLPQQAVLLGDRQEGRWLHQLTVFAEHSQVGVVDLYRLAVQADQWLVVQDEAVAVDGVADPHDPGIDPLLLGAIDRAGIENV